MKYGLLPVTCSGENAMKNNLFILVISNITTNPFLDLKLRSAFCFGEKCITRHLLLSDIYAADSKKALVDAHQIIVLINYCEMIGKSNFVSTDEACFEKKQEMLASELQNTYSYLKTICKGQIVWFGLESNNNALKYVLGNTYLITKSINDLNKTLYATINNDDVFVDLNAIIAEVGINNSYSYKDKNRWNAIYSNEIWEKIAEEVKKQYNIFIGSTKKCIILDCDNVLWGGTIAEDGIENIKLGQYGEGRIFSEFQELLVSLYKHGVILTVCSKNDFNDIMRVFHEHNGMIIKEEHISCFMVNWEPKVNNIQLISDKLKIDLDSIVFVDDSLFEIETAKAFFPQITAFLFEKNFNYSLLSCFNLKTKVCYHEIERRTETYKTDTLREELKNSSVDFSDYLKKLKVNIELRTATSSEYRRISEITQRTNRCTNGKRYTVEELKYNSGNNNGNLFSVYVSDCFSDLGLVGAMEVCEKTVTLFSLSCRSLGRGVEERMIDYLLELFDVREIVFCNTHKNEWLMEWFDKKGIRIKNQGVE